MGSVSLGFLPHSFSPRSNLLRLTSFNVLCVLTITGENPLKESGEDSVSWGAEGLQSVLWHTSIKHEGIKPGRGCLGQGTSRKP